MLVIFDAVFPLTPKIGNLCIPHYFKDKHFLNIEKVNAFLRIKSDKISHKAPKMQKFNLNSVSHGLYRSGFALIHAILFILFQFLPISKADILVFSSQPTELL